MGAAERSIPLGGCCKGLSRPQQRAESGSCLEFALTNQPLAGTSKNPVPPQRLIERCGSDFSRDKGLRRRPLAEAEAATAGSPLWTKSTGHSRCTCVLDSLCGST
jgi:hypothetical protein